MIIIAKALLSALTADTAADGRNVSAVFALIVTALINSARKLLITLHFRLKVHGNNAA